MPNKFLALIAMSLFFVSNAYAFQVDKKIGSSVSSTISFKSHAVTGKVVTVNNSQRDILDFTDGIVTVGEVVKHSVVKVHVNQGGSGVGISGVSTVYAGLTHGAITAGGSASVGYEAMSGSSWDNSAVHETGLAVTDVDLYDLGGWFPNHVGSSTESIHTDTWVNLANVDYTQSSGSWSASSVYVK